LGFRGTDDLVLRDLIRYFSPQGMRGSSLPRNSEFAILPSNSTWTNRSQEIQTQGEILLRKKDRKERGTD
jgi:hypothetical protein